MSQGLKIILILAAGIAIIAGIIFFIIPKKEVSPSASEETTAPVSEFEVIEVSAPESEQALVPVTPVANQREIIAENLRQLSSAFAERYGSFSNQMNFENISDLYQVMTNNLSGSKRKWVQAQPVNSQPAKDYFGMTTRTLAVEIKAADYEKGSSLVVVKTQRQESTDKETKIFYQDLELKFQKENNEWKVDQANWK